MSATEGRLGVRGGTTESLAEGQQLQGDFKPAEAERVKRMILFVAADLGEFHADHAATWEVSEPNIIGSQVNALARAGLLEKRNRVGAVEHRKARARAAHGRASYVWRLTAKGRSFVERSRAEVAASGPQLAETHPDPDIPTTPPMFGDGPPAITRGYADPEPDDWEES